jgi:hypothetical protein
MGLAKFRVHGKLDSAGSLQDGTVVIDRESGMFTVRPLRRRAVFQMRLSDVADMVVHRVILSDAHDAKIAKLAKRKKFG